MKIGEYLEQNKTELWNELIKHELLNMDDVEDGYITIDDLDCNRTGFYEYKDDIYLIEADEICNVMEGLDLSFDRKYLSFDGYEGGEFEIEVNGKKVFGLRYNV